jgi:hypothetical protein
MDGQNKQDAMKEQKNESPIEYCVGKTRFPATTDM